MKNGSFLKPQNSNYNFQFPHHRGNALKCLICVVDNAVQSSARHNLIYLINSNETVSNIQFPSTLAQSRDVKTITKN